MTKSEKWACDRGCDLKKEPCSHLEELLPQMGDKRLIRFDVSNMSLDVFQVYRPTFSLEEFQDLMRSHGFVDSWDLELLTAKYFHGMSNRKITKDQNFCSTRTTDRRLKALHALLVERGFKPRKIK